MDAILYAHNDVASQWIQQQYQQKALLPLICSNYTMPDPNFVAGHICLLDGVNIKPGDFSNLVFTMEDCLGMEGDWTSYSCKDVLQTLFTNNIVEANASDMLLLDMPSGSLTDICCNETRGNSIALLAKEEIRNGWWNAAQEWREGHSKNLIIITGVMSIISVIASSIFMWMILRSHDRVSTTSNRLFLGLCISDICFSLPHSFFGMMLPNEVGYYSWNAMGSMTTCQIQGFVNAFGSCCGAWYNASLCLYYLAVVKYEKSDDYIRTKIEPFLHAVPLVAATIYSVYTVASGRMNAGGQGTCFGCYYSPPHCWEVENDFVVEGVFDIPCGRGRSNFEAYVFICFSFKLILPAIVMITALTEIYRAVRQSEKKKSKYGAGSLRKNIEKNVSESRSKLGQSLGLGRSSRMNFNECLNRVSIPTKMKKKDMRLQSRLVMFRALAYCCGWLLTWIMYFPVMIIAYVFDSFVPLVLLYLVVVFQSLQGLYNLAIFMHPKIISTKRKSEGDNNNSWWRAFVTVFWSKGREKKKMGSRNALDPPTTKPRDNSKKLESINERAFSPNTHQNTNHLSFGRIRSAASNQNA